MSSKVTRTALALLTVLTTPPAWAQDRTICPDRPGRGASACTVEQGHAQVELGLFDDSFQHRSGVTTDTDNVGVMAKWGVSDRMDVEAGMALYQEQRATGTRSKSGIGDLFLHAKYNPRTTDGPFALVLDPFLKLPTATGGLGNGAVEGGLVLPMSYDLAATGPWR